MINKNTRVAALIAVGALATTLFAAENPMVGGAPMYASKTIVGLAAKAGADTARTAAPSNARKVSLFMG